MSKRILKPLIILIVIICMMACVPGVYSYMVQRSESVTNTLAPANVDCSVHDVFDGTTKSEVTIRNDSNVEAYVRVRVVSYWVDSKGGVIARQSPTVEISYDNSLWYYDEDNQTYYYKVPLAAGASTDDLLNEGQIVLSSYTNESDENYKKGDVIFTYHQVVEFVAEAIQSKPKDAVENSWGVTVNDGTITRVN